MLAFYVRSLLGGFLSLVLASLILHSAIWYLPGGPDYAFQRFSPNSRCDACRFGYDMLIHRVPHLGEPFPQPYLYFASNLLKGDIDAIVYVPRPAAKTIVQDSAALMFGFIALLLAPIFVLMAISLLQRCSRQSNQIQVMTDSPSRRFEHMRVMG